MLFALVTLMVSGCSQQRLVEPAAPLQSRHLTVAAVSMESTIRETEQNLRRIEEWARRAAAERAELVLFPETALSGWWRSRENRAYGEPADGPSVQRLIRLARELNIIMAVGMTERDGDRAYITQVLLDGRRVLGTHRKTLLAPGEEMVWDAGDDANVFEIKGIRIGIAICFESVQPTMCSRLKARGAEIILAPYANATDPDELLDGRRRYPYARARENDIWYVACDVPPRDDSGTLRRGAAYVIDPTGKLIDITKPDATGENMVVQTLVLDRQPGQVN